MNGAGLRPLGAATAPTAAATTDGDQLFQKQPGLRPQPTSALSVCVCTLVSVVFYRVLEKYEREFVPKKNILEEWLGVHCNYQPLPGLSIRRTAHTVTAMQRGNSEMHLGRFP